MTSEKALPPAIAAAAELAVGSSLAVAEKQEKALPLTFVEAALAAVEEDIGGTVADVAAAANSSVAVDSFDDIVAAVAGEDTPHHPAAFAADLDCYDSSQ